MKQPVMIVIGTRPEGIKLLPVYLACKRAGIPVVLCSTSQHDELLRSVFKIFDITPDYDLSIMKPRQDLFDITCAVMLQIREVFTQVMPSLVLVQGDTTTAMASALAAFYLHIPVGHVEAGLRTNDLHSPFPEEMNRRFISLVAAYHFAPTMTAVANILLQGVHRDTVLYTGNTIVDALYFIREKIGEGSLVVSPDIQKQVTTARQKGYKIVLFTMHRRESFEGGISRVLQAVEQGLAAYQNLFVIFPCHPNPTVKELVARSNLAVHQRVYLCEAVAYPDLVYLLMNCDWVMTDSGGIQEEAASLGKYTLVLREHTERMESVWAGISHIVGTDSEKIRQGIALMMRDKKCEPVAVYGDGHASQRIVNSIVQNFGLQKEITPSVSSITPDQPLHGAPL